MRINKKEEIATHELDGLLSLVRYAPFVEPSTEIRENLRRMTAISPGRATNRLHAKVDFHWTRWAILSSACAAMLLSIGFYYLPWLHRTVPPNTLEVSHAAHMEANHNLGRDLSGRPRSSRKVIVVHSRQAGHLPLRKAVAASTSFDFTFPYSNPDITNGTATTIQVSVSREDLFALGIPLSDGSSQSRYLAEVAIGDDGLPRSIYVPLPLRTIN